MRISPRRTTVLVLLALVLGVGACDRLLSAERRIERAEEAFEAGRYEAAINDVKTALEAEPENVGGRILLARISLRIGDWESARKELDRAIAAGADPAPLQELHYDIFLKQGRFQDALIAAAADEQLEPLRRSVVMATAQAGLGQFEDAAKSVEDALKLDRTDRSARLLQARLQMISGRMDEARAILEDLLQEDPEDAEVRLNQGRLEIGAGNAKAAQTAFIEAQKTAGNRLNVVDLIAVHAGAMESSMSLGDLEVAETALKSLRAVSPEGFVTRYLAARLALLRDEPNVAVTELQRALQGQPDNAPARLLFAAALLEAGSNEQAEAELSQLLARQPENLEARRLLARIYLGRSDAAAARRLVAEMPTGGDADPTADWFAGAVMMMAGQTAEGIRRVEEAAGASPDNLALQLDLASAYLSAGRRADAQKTLDRMPAGEGGPRRRQLEIMATVLGQDHVTARRGVDRLVQENPQDADLLTTAGLYILNAGDPAAAATILERALAVAPEHIEAIIGLAQAAYNGGDVPAAEVQLQRAIEVAPGDERAYLVLARLQASRGNRAQATQLLERAIGAEPGAVESRIQLADWALVDGDTERMKAMAGQALSVTHRSVRALDRVGRLYMRGSLFDEALSLFNEAASKGSDEAAVNAALALRALGRNDESRSRLESVASRRRDWPVAAAQLAWLEISQKRYDAALSRVDEFQRAGGDIDLADQLRGDVYIAAGKHAQAIAAYQRASAAKPTGPLAIKLYRARRLANSPDADASLRQLLESNPDDQVARFLLAEYAHFRGERKAAIAEYQRALNTGSSPAVLNNLAWLYYEEGDPRAEELARRAVAARPDSAAIADTLGWILVEKGKIREGLPILEKAVKDAPDNREIQYHYAAALARDGKRAEATAGLRALLADGAEFPSRQQAEALLREMGGR